MPVAAKAPSKNNYTPCLSFCLFSVLRQALHNPAMHSLTRLENKQVSEERDSEITAQSVQFIFTCCLTINSWAGT